MSRKQRRLLIAVTIISLLLSLPWGTQAEDEFKALVKHIESHFHVKRTRVPFLGLAVRFVRPHGLKNIRLAVFDEQRFNFKPGEEDAFDEVLRQTLSDRWQPLIRARSRADHELTYIYARAAGDDVEVMVVSLESDEAAVIQAKVDPQRLSLSITHMFWVYVI